MSFAARTVRKRKYFIYVDGHMRPDDRPYITLLAYFRLKIKPSIINLICLYFQAYYLEFIVLCIYPINEELSRTGFYQFYQEIRLFWGNLQVKF